MTANEFSNLIRKKDAKFLVRKIILHAEGQIIRGQGSLQIVEDDFEIYLEVASKYQVPNPKREIWKPADAWKLLGEIEDGLKFSSDTVSPSGEHYSWQHGKKPFRVQKLRLERIELLPIGFDALSEAQKDKLLKRTPPKRRKHPEVEFHAVLFGCEPVLFNAGTETKVRNDFLGVCGGNSALDTFIDRDNTYDFALIKKDGDAHIHFRSKSRFHSVSEEDDWRRFYSLLYAVGFTHGFQPWPYRIEFWRGGRKIADHIKVPHSLTKTRYAPFDRQMSRWGNLRRKGSRNSVIRIAARFFEGQTPLSQRFSHLLFLFREAGSASFDVKTLALCSLFEGIVTLMFDELKLEDELRRKDSQFDDYLQLRDRLARRLRRLSSRNQRPSFKRLAGSLSSAKEFRVKDKFRAVCEHFGLNYDNEMKPHFDAWENKRNLLMHGRWERQDSDFSDQALEPVLNFA